MARKAAASFDVTQSINSERTISLAAATRLIVERVYGPTATRDRTVLNRVRNRLKYAVKKRRLPVAGDKTFAFGALAHWASEIWPGQLSDWARFRKTSGSMSGTLSDLTACIEGICLPPIPEDPRELLLGLSRKLANCFRENERLRAEIEELRSYKILDEERRRKASAYGRSGGRGNYKK